MNEALPEGAGDPVGAITAFVSVWNGHDMTGLGELFTEGAVWVPVFESRLDGREAIVADFKQIHDDWAGDTTIAISDVEPRLVAPHVAVVTFKTAFMGDGQPVPGAGRAMMLTVVREGLVWRIAAGQVTKPEAG
jgi:uncharacterized protein (TIGR02246 family)